MQRWCGGRGITNYILIEVAAAEAMTNSQNWRRTPIRTRSTHNAHTEDVSVAPPLVACCEFSAVSDIAHYLMSNLGDRCCCSCSMSCVLQEDRARGKGRRQREGGKLLQMSTVFAMGKVARQRQIEARGN